MCSMPTRRARPDAAGELEIGGIGVDGSAARIGDDAGFADRIGKAVEEGAFLCGLAETDEAGEFREKREEADQRQRAPPMASGHSGTRSR